jgi:hypothetical protein
MFIIIPPACQETGNPASHPTQAIHNQEFCTRNSVQQFQRVSPCRNWVQIAAHVIAKLARSTRRIADLKFDVVEEAETQEGVFRGAANALNLLPPAAA